MTLGFLGLAHWFHPHDPFAVYTPLPWIWMAPLLVSLRYGLWAGMVSTGLILGCGWMEERILNLNMLPMEKSYVLGLLLLTLIAGEFGSRWNVYLTQIREWNEYLRARIHEMTQAYHLLGMSHHQLEKQLAGRPLTLRDVLTRLRGLLLETETGVSSGAAQRF